MVENGREALAALEHGEYIAVLMDCQMPVMDGLTASSLIRERERALGETGQPRHVPIIALTANALEGDREQCLAAGMDDFIAKPLRAETLAHTLERWISPVQAAARPAESDAVDRIATSERVRAAQVVTGRGFGQFICI